jgi:uncharacterized protein
MRAKLRIASVTFSASRPQDEAGMARAGHPMNWSTVWKLDTGTTGILAAGPWLRLRVLSWAAFLFGCATAAFFATFEARDWLGLPRAADYAFAIMIPAMALLLYGLAVRFFEKRPVRELPLRLAPADLPVGMLIGFAFIASVLALLWLLGLYQVGWGHWHHWYNYFLFNAYISAVLEELAFRGILLRLVARISSPVTGLLVSALLFGAAHAAHAAPVAIAQIVVAGLILGLLYMVSGRLWVAIGAHIGYDFTEWSLMGIGDHDGLLAASPAPHASAFLTGGSFGPDGSVLTTLVGLAFIVAIVAAGARRRSMTMPPGPTTSRG